MSRAVGPVSQAALLGPVNLAAPRCADKLAGFSQLEAARLPSQLESGVENLDSLLFTQVDILKHDIKYSLHPIQLLYNHYSTQGDNNNTRTHRRRRTHASDQDSVATCTLLVPVRAAVASPCACMRGDEGARCQVDNNISSTCACVCSIDNASHACACVHSIASTCRVPGLQGEGPASGGDGPCMGGVRRLGKPGYKGYRGRRVVCVRACASSSVRVRAWR
jgi:hypothetical protein